MTHFLERLTYSARHRESLADRGSGNCVTKTGRGIVASQPHDVPPKALRPPGAKSNGPCDPIPDTLRVIPNRSEDGP
jgi:hypothetical protein